MRARPAALAVTGLVTASLTLAPAGSAAPIGPAAVAQPTYTAVIDAGSSGSRIYLYEGRASSTTVGVTTLFEAEPETVPGLSSFLAHPKHAGARGVTPLTDELDTYLTTAGIAPSAVTVYLLATAGMRNVQREDPRAVRRIYASARTALEDSGLRVGRVGTISGTSEGLYSWTDVNYLRGVFTGRAEPRGIVEVGGASAQVAFRTKSGGPNVVRVRIAGKHHSVYSVSYLGLGQNDARQDILQPSDARTGSACFPNNVSGERPRRYRLNNDVPVKAAASRFRLGRCTKLSADTVQKVSENRYNRTRTHGATIDEIQDTRGFGRARFVGLASIAFALLDFDVVGGHESKKLARSLRRVCAGDDAWPRVLEQFGGEITPFAENGCVNATYTRTFVLSGKGLGISSDRFRGATKVGGESPTWTRGFAVLQAAKHAVA